MSQLGQKRTIHYLGKVFLPTILSCSLFLTACVENQGTRSSRKSSALRAITPGNTKGASAGKTDGGITDLTSSIEENGKAELRNIVDPIDGVFRKKVSIPKNFNGYLYLSGLNITSLSNRLVSVRFSFGRELETITIPATVGRAAGLTPQTDIEVLILDMGSKPFENIRLLYDLFDYNDYRDKSTGKEVLEPTKDPRNPLLYCRGLKLEHDPTFVRTADDNTCDETGEQCLYAYAKIRDSGLFQLSNPNDPSSARVAITPSLPQVDFKGSGYSQETVSNNLKKCLPDNFNRGEFNSNFNTSLANLSVGSEVILDSKSYIYNGPYRAIGPSQWEIGSNGVTSAAFFPPPNVPAPSDDQTLFNNYPAGLFQRSGNSSLDANTGHTSFLFPRAGKMSLKAEVEYFGSLLPWGDTIDAANPTPPRAKTSLVASGDSSWMHGCNMRVTNFDTFTNEGIGSCNVTATIEVITEEGGTAVVLATSNEVKLQLLRPSLTNFQGQEVLYSSMKTCSSSRGCGSSECCFNNRCWDRSLVSQCLDDVNIEGNRGIGEVCSSDYECSSLCCNQATSTCAVHTNIGTTPVLCGKQPGQQCVAKEWCRKENIADCYVVKTGTSPTGTQECALRCYNVPTHGNCRNGICLAPVQPTPPPFNPTNPDCTTARDPLTTVPN